MDVVTTGFSIIDERFAAMNTRIDGIDGRLTGVEHRLGRVEVAVLDLQEEFRAAQVAVDDNSIQLVDHERRIRRLEKRCV
jgi:hypothetical protein